MLSRVLGDVRPTLSPIVVRVSDKRAIIFGFFFFFVSFIRNGVDDAIIIIIILFYRYTLNALFVRCALPTRLIIEILSY